MKHEETSSIISESNVGYEKGADKKFQNYDDFIKNKQYNEAEKIILEEYTEHFIKSDKEIESQSKKYNYVLPKIQDNKNNELQQQIEFLNSKYKNILVKEEFATAFNYVFTYLKFHIERSNAKQFDAKELSSEHQIIILCSDLLIEFKMKSPTFEKFHEKYKEIRKSTESAYVQFLLIQSSVLYDNNTNISEQIQKIEQKLNIKLDEDAIIKKLKNIKEITNQIELAGNNNQTLINRKNKMYNELYYLLFHDIKCFEMFVLLKIEKKNIIKSIMYLCKSKTQFALRYNYRSIDEKEKINQILEIIDFFKDINIPIITMRDANTIKNKEDAFKLFNKIDITAIIDQCKQKENGELFIGDNESGYYLNNKFFLSEISDFKFYNTHYVQSGSEEKEEIEKKSQEIFNMNTDELTTRNAFSILAEMSLKNKIKSEKFMKAYEEMLFTILIMEVSFFDIINDGFTKTQNSDEYEPLIAVGRSRLESSEHIRLLDSSDFTIIPKGVDQEGNGFFYHKLTDSPKIFAENLHQIFSDEYYDFPFLSYCIRGSMKDLNILPFPKSNWLLKSKKHTSKPNILYNISKLFFIVLVIIMLVFLFKK